METVKDSVGMQANNSRLVVKYKMWKQPLHKWDEFIDNRHRREKQIDQWSQKILNEATGNIVAYDCGGLFFKEFNSDITVVEHQRCPIKIPGMLYLDDGHTFNSTFDSLIMINSIAMKLNHSLVDVFTVAGMSRAGYKHELLKWLRPGSKIFLSFSDWHQYYDRLRYTADEFVDMQLAELENVGLVCKYRKVDLSTVDYVNGNVKLVFENTGIAY